MCLTFGKEGMGGRAVGGRVGKMKGEKAEKEEKEGGGGGRERGGAGKKKEEKEAVEEGREQGE